MIKGIHNTLAVSFFYIFVMNADWSCFMYVVLQTYNEIQRCFLTVGQVYPEDMFVFLLYVGKNCRSVTYIQVF